MLDGTYFNGWCVLIAFNGQHVIDWQWCDTEKKIAWQALLERIPAPKIAIIEVGKNNVYRHPTKEALERLGEGLWLGLEEVGDGRWVERQEAGAGHRLQFHHRVQRFG